MESKYTSKYGATRKISASQYLAEFICERQAKREKTTLPLKFWNHPDWSKQFLAQITHANALLKEHSCLDIINALKSKRGESIYSLGNKKPIEALLKKVEFKAILAKKNVPNRNGNIFTDDTEIFVSDKDIVLVHTKQEIIITTKKNLWEKLS